MPDDVTPNGAGSAVVSPFAAYDMGRIDLTRRDELTDEEWVVLTSSHAAFGYPEGHPAYRIWRVLDRPEQVKQKLAVVEACSPRSNLPKPIVNLYAYILMGYEPGVVYMARHCVNAGYSKRQLTDVYALAHTHTLAKGLTEAVLDDELLAILRDAQETSTVRYPVGWDDSPDPDAFRSGMESSELAASPEDIARLRGWYETWLGDIPAWVSFLIEFNPDLLKQLRLRFESAITALPKQYAPFCLLYWSAVVGNPEGIREHVQMAKGFGMTRDDVLATLSLAAGGYGGPEIFSVVDRCAGDLFRHW